MFGHDAQLDAASGRRQVRLRDRFGSVFHQVDEHLLDQNRVHHDFRQARRNVVGQAHVVATQLDVGKFHRVVDHGADV